MKLNTNRHTRGNILLMTLFVLFASALLGVFVSLMMRDFLKYNNEILHYHQANTLAKSASELWFYLIWSSEIGFDFNDQKELDKLITKNIPCPLQQSEEEKKEWKCWLSRSMSLDITGLKNQISLVLWAGQSLIIPGFYNSIKDFSIQTWAWSENPTLTPKEKENPNLKISNISIDTNEMPIISENMPWSRNNNQYLVITNLSTEKPQQIELAGKHLFDGTISMKVSGEYGKKVVSRNFDLKKGLPEFLQGDNYLTNE